MSSFKYRDPDTNKWVSVKCLQGEKGDPGGIPVPETAEVGQTIVVKAVDENGKPTEWESANFPSGSVVEPLKLIKTVTVPADIKTDTSGVTWTQSTADTTKPKAWSVNTDKEGNAFNLKYCVIIYKCAKAGSYTSSPFITLRGIVSCSAPGLGITTSKSSCGVFVWDGKILIHSPLHAMWEEGALKIVRLDTQYFVTPSENTTNLIRLAFNEDIYWPEGAEFKIYGVRA